MSNNDEHLLESNYEEPTTSKPRPKLVNTLSISNSSWNYTVFSFAFGHFLNGMCAGTWFSYLFVFLNSVPRLKSVPAGIVMFSGQIADAVSTPIAGLISDKSSGIKWLNLGRRKMWIFVGSIIVIISFSLLFGFSIPNYISDHPSQVVLVIYCAFFASTFNLGWALVQVCHMAMVPEISKRPSRQVLLNSVRYVGEVVGNMVVFVAMMVLVEFFGDANADTEHQRNKFTALTVIIIVSGIIGTIIFLIGTPEPYGLNQINARPSELDIVSTKRYKVEWTYYFRLPEFYFINGVYMCTRCVINVSQVYYPLYLIHSLQLTGFEIGLGPMIVYISSLISAGLMKKYNDMLGRKATYSTGVTFFCIGCGLLYFCTTNTLYLMYIGIILMGAGNATMLVTATSMASDLIGQKTETSAYVFGALSLTDKLSSGIVIILLQNILDSTEASMIPNFYRMCLGLIPPCIAVGSMVFAILIDFEKIKDEDILLNAASSNRF